MKRRIESSEQPEESKKRQKVLHSNDPWKLIMEFGTWPDRAALARTDKTRHAIVKAATERNVDKVCSFCTKPYSEVGLDSDYYDPQCENCYRWACDSCDSARLDRVCHWCNWCSRNSELTCQCYSGQGGPDRYLFCKWCSKEYRRQHSPRLGDCPYTKKDLKQGVLDKQLLEHAKEFPEGGTVLQTPEELEAARLLFKKA